MKNIIIVFTKVPKVGDTKTRLTEKRGGILEPEEAMHLYEGLLLDVINASVAANCGEVKICYNQSGDREYLEKLLSGVTHRDKIKDIYPDQGGSFDECMQYATDYVLKNGSKERLADSVIVVGGDLPSLQPGILQDVMKKIERLAATDRGHAVALDCDAKREENIGAALVEGACQEGGFSIIGYTCTTPFTFAGVFYNMTGVTTLDMTVNKAAEKKIPMAACEMTPDIDIPIDLASMIPVLRVLELAAIDDETIIAPVNTIRILNELGLESSSTPPQR